jgi:hypothetical protein
VPKVITDNFTIIAVFMTTQSAATDPQQNWYNGMGLVDAEVYSTLDDFGMSLLNGRLATGTGEQGGWDTTILSPSSYNNGQGYIAVFRRVRNTGSLSQFVCGTSTGTATGGTQALDEPSRITLGSLQTNINYYDGDIAEVLIYDTALSDSNRRAAEDYLRGKYNICPAVGGVSFPITSVSAATPLIGVGLVLGVAALGGAAWYARRRR